jgi:hypothetical protein
MKVLYHLLYRHSTGADRWIAEAWQAGFEYHACNFSYYSERRVDADKIRASGADLFMSDLCTLNPSDTVELCRLRKMGTKVAVWVHWPLVPAVQAMQQTMLTLDFADIYYGEREPEGMDDFERVTCKRYLPLTNAARHDIHQPAEFDPKYAYDIAFVGARLPHKKWMNDLILKNLVPRYRVGIFGPGWTRRDKLLGVAARGMRKLGLTALSTPIDRMRITLPLDKEPTLYSSSKICINFHERESDGSVSHNIVNQRLFKVAASGGFQIVDDVPGIRRYFSEDEIVALPLEAAKWIETIDRFLADTPGREVMRKKAAQRAHREHYSFHRAAVLVRHLERIGI